MITDSDLELIYNRCISASAGPWLSFIEGRDHECGSNFIRTADGKDIELIGATDSDQDFIASARQDIILLINEIKDLKSKI